MTDLLIDRHKERELFAELVTESGPRALLLSDRQGQGKSRLVRELFATCVRGRIPVALTDLAEQQLQSPFGFADRVASMMGRSGVKFPMFAETTAAARAGISGSVRQQGDQHGGSQTAVSIINSTVHVAGSALLDDYVQLQCANALVDDLVVASRSRRLVLLVDTYNASAADDVRSWFFSVLDELLVHRAETPGVLIVVAGIDLLPELLPVDSFRQMLGEHFERTVHPLPHLSRWGPDDVRTLFTSMNRECPEGTDAYIAERMAMDHQWTVTYVASAVVDFLGR